MFKIFEEKTKNIIIENFGERIIDGKCSKCGKSLPNKEFCDCLKSEKINKYTQKAYSILEDFANFYQLYGDDSKLIKSKSVKLPNLFIGIDYDDYIVKNESQRVALEEVKKYDFESVKNYIFGKNLILLGNYGTGKTMLMSILARSISANNLTNVLFINAVDLLNEIKSTFNDNSKNTLQVVERYKNAKFLFLDDIDKLNPTQYIQEFMYSIVNYRVEKELPIIISANHSLEQLDEEYFGEATVSRLVSNAQIIKFTHENWRVS